MQDVVEVIAPANEEGTKATLLRWCKAIGEAVTLDEPLLELETDKVTVEIPSPASGQLTEILKQLDEEVAPGELLARVRIAAARAVDGAAATDGAAVADGGDEATRVPVAGAADGAVAAAGDDAARAMGDVVRVSGDVASTDAAKPQLSPAVRRLLAEHSLSAADINGSGRNGRVTAQDIVRHVDGTRAGVPTSASAVSAAAAGSRVPHSPIRRRIADHMARSLAVAPHVTTLFEADLSRVLVHRGVHAAEFERQGARLTLTVYFIAACAQALRAHPKVNASFHEDALELHADCNIGVGTALGNDGLIVPVIHRAQELTLIEVARRLGQLVADARGGRLSPADVRGGTFTISNHGVGGSVLAAPIVINQPQVAILGVGKVERRVCVLQVDGAEAIGVRPKCYLTLTIDHRALDAFQANAFLSSVVTTLEQWPAD